jgi:GT2 family glycosyltransferase
MQTEVPTVLAVLVTRNGAPWLPRALAALARQTHPRLGVLAVDNASTDGSADLLEQALGRRRVLRLGENPGFAGAVSQVLELTAARKADYLLLLHDDVSLDAEAVARLVDEASRVPGAGIVGPKVLDWQEPQVLREVGFSADRFGYPHSPLEEGEIDQGQYDAPREVLFVSSVAMLVARDAIDRAGGPDQRLGSAQADLDFCWRIRLAGYRVLVTPRAVAFHRMAGEEGERTDTPLPRERYQIERAGLAGMLVNARLLTLLWVLPAYAVQGIGRLVLYVVTRRFDRVGEVLAAWGWNLVHLPGTIRRRVRAQATRRVGDREIARFMSPAGTRLQRWATQASGMVVGHRAAQVEAGEELEAPPLRERVASVVGAHPVAVASIAGIVATLLAFRGVLFVPAIEGGAYPVFPDGAGAFFRAIGAAWRSTGFGGPEMASPALVPLGVGSVLALGNPDLLGRLLVGFGPLAAGISCYRAVRRFGPGAGASALAAGCYAVGAPTLWAASEGRIAVIVLLVTLPWLWRRFVDAFAPGGPAHPLRWAAGTAMVLALTLSFEPGGWVAVAATAAPMIVLPERFGSRVRGAALLVAVTVAAAALVLPFMLHLLEAGGIAPAASARPRFADLLLLAPGPGPGSGLTAAFLPVGGLLGFAVAERRGRRGAWRALAVAGAAIPLAWLAAAGRLPVPMRHPAAFLVAAAFALALLIGVGIAGLPSGVRRTAFGTPQVVAAGLAVILGLGIAGQVVRALPGDWAVGAARLAPAWPVVSSSAPTGPFRVLWLRAADGLPLPPPGGDPDGVVATGDTAVAYGVTGRSGRSVLAMGIPHEGAPYARLESVLAAMLSGGVRHGGALLAPMGIRFVVAGAGRLPSVAAGRVGQQVDLDLVQRAGGLWIYRNARALPTASVIPGDSAVAVARSPAPLSPVGLDTGTAAALRGGPESLRGTVPEGGTSLALVADRFDPGWRASSGLAPFPAFGWAVGFQAPPGPLVVRFDGGPRRGLELAGLGLLWGAALWVVRRSGREERRGRPRRTAAMPPRDAPAEPVGRLSRA